MDQSGHPTVSVVIPTRNRPALVKRAVTSALAQTLSNLEVIVVIDGTDRDSKDIISAIGDPRVTVIETGVSKGAPSARNRGFEAARGTWTALLDDDDEWMPEKLARQIELASTSSKAYPIIATKLIARSPRAEYEWPTEAPNKDIPISEYLMVRPGLFPGGRLIQTSTVLAKTELFRNLPYTPDLKRHQDWDWLLKALDRNDTELLFLNEPLAVWYIEEVRSTISLGNDFRPSLEWARSNRTLITDKAYSSFILLYVGSVAARGKAYSYFFPLLWEALSADGVSIRQTFTYFAYWIVPVTVRRSLRAVFSSNRRP